MDDNDEDLHLKDLSDEIRYSQKFESMNLQDVNLSNDNHNQ